VLDATTEPALLRPSQVPAGAAVQVTMKLDGALMVCEGACLHQMAAHQPHIRVHRLAELSSARWQTVGRDHKDGAATAEECYVQGRGPIAEARRPISNIRLRHFRCTRRAGEIMEGKASFSEDAGGEWTLAHRCSQRSGAGALQASHLPSRTRQEHAPANDRDEEVGGFGDELEGAV